jgi:SAM-dependent methyltransferase
LSAPPRLPDADLERSGVVSNCRMNRERRLTGRGGYEAELRFDLVEFLTARLQQHREVAWLDLCCGTGRALVEAAGMFERESRGSRESRLRIVGVDLVAHDLAIDSQHTSVRFEEVSLHSWKPSEPFDLITCVHGLHYLGDKLATIAACVAALKPGGVFQAHLDLANLRHTDQKRFGPSVKLWLVSAGFDWHAGFHRLTRVGPVELEGPWHYVGADDSAGPNFTGQPAVNSWYGAR